MLPWGLSCLSVLGAAGTALLGTGLLLSLAQHLWTLRWTLSRDRASALPLPKGSMGWPFFGETLHWLVQVSRSHPAVLAPQHGPFFPPTGPSSLTVFPGCLVGHILSLRGPESIHSPRLCSAAPLKGSYVAGVSPQRNLNTARHTPG